MTTTLGHHLRSRAEREKAPERAIALRAAASIAHLYERNIYVRSWIDMLIEQEDA